MSSQVSQVSLIKEGRLGLISQDRLAMLVRSDELGRLGQLSQLGQINKVRSGKLFWLYQLGCIYQVGVVELAW